MYDLKLWHLAELQTMAYVSVAEPAMYDLKQRGVMCLAIVLGFSCWTSNVWFETVLFLSLNTITSSVSVAEPAMYDLKLYAQGTADDDNVLFQLLNQQCMIWNKLWRSRVVNVLDVFQLLNQQCMIWNSTTIARVAETKRFQLLNQQCMIWNQVPTFNRQGNKVVSVAEPAMYDLKR